MNSLKFPLLTVILFSMILVSCKKKDDDTEETTAPANKITSQFYFNATIDGKEILHQDGVKFYGNGISSSGGNSGSGNEYIIAEQTTFGTFNLDEASFFGLIGVFGTTYPSIDEKKNIFKTGSYNYGHESTELAGAIVEYVDEGGEYWTTDYVGGSQTNSSFKITEVIDDTTYPEFYLIITAEFTCTLYDKDGNSKKLTAGKGRGRVISNN